MVAPALAVQRWEWGGYEVVGELVSAISYLRAQAAEVKITGLWREVVALLGARAS